MLGFEARGNGTRIGQFVVALIFEAYGERLGSRTCNPSDGCDQYRGIDTTAEEAAERNVTDKLAGDRRFERLPYQSRPIPFGSGFGIVHTWRIPVRTLL